MNREELRSLVRTVFIVCFIVTLALGLWIAGTPENARKKKEDLALIKNLDEITYKIGNYIERKGGLPKSLDRVSVTQDMIKDITYNPGDEKNGIYYYQLCSEFNLNGEPSDRTGRNYGYDAYGIRGRFYKHAAGYVCFKINCFKGKSGDSIFCTPQKND